MNAREYQRQAMRTNDGLASERLVTCMETYTHLENNTVKDDGDISIGGLLNGCLGLTGEAGEVSDMIKKWVFHQNPKFDKEHLKKELGDVMWYIAMICESMGFEMEEIMEMNIEKLKARYPEGFDTERANNRAESDV